MASWIRLPGLILLFVTVCGAVASRSSDRPIVGAIRWDAWTGGEITAQVERTLSPKKYQYRLPWFAKVVADDKATIDGSPQPVMDQEIRFAADAGLDYWAFLIYGQDSSMSVALRQYLQSPLRKRLRFCMILHHSFSLPDAQWPAERDRLIALLKEDGYQTVLDNRPLVFAFQISHQGQFPAARFAELRQAARDAKLNPYFVYMGWEPAGDYAKFAKEGFDAVSAYAHPGSQARFADLAAALENGPWQRAAAKKVPFVPLVTTGWDKQPRKDHPVSWEKNDSYHQQATFPSTATPDEIATHLKRAITFVKDNPVTCPANAVIIYAWNEHDEGGWLAPTWNFTGKPNTQRLDALRPLLEKRD